MSDLGKPAGYVARQVNGWITRYANSQTDDLPAMNRLAAWLSQRIPTESRAAEAAAESKPLDQTTLVGTKWEREGFGFEFGAGGKLFIGGRERAQWRVEGSRIRLYRDATGEEHWLDIVGDKLVWEGREIARRP